MEARNLLQYFWFHNRSPGNVCIRHMTVSVGISIFGNWVLRNFWEPRPSVPYENSWKIKKKQITNIWKIFFPRTIFRTSNDGIFILSLQNWKMFPLPDRKGSVAGCSSHVTEFHVLPHLCPESWEWRVRLGIAFQKRDVRRWGLPCLPQIESQAAGS